MGFAKWLAGRFGGGNERGEEVNPPDYKLIFNSSSNPMAFTGPDGGRIVDVNEAWVRAIGISRDRCVGKTALDFGLWVDPAEREACYAILSEKGQLVEHEIRLWAKATQRVFLASARFVEMPGGRYILWEFRDITERKIAEEKTQLLAKVFEQSAEGLCVTDMDGTVMVSNRAFALMHGYGQEEIVGKNLSIFHSPEQMQAVNHANRKLKETGEFMGEIWHARRDGTTFLGLMHNVVFRAASGGPAGMIGTLQDITERKKAEEEAGKALEDWKETFDAVNDLVMLLDKDYRITRANSAAARFFNKPLSEIIGDHCYKLMHGTDLPPDFCPIDKMTKSKSHEEIEINLPGTDTWLLVSVDPILDDKKEVLRIVHIVKDITDRKKADEALEKSEAMLRSVIGVAPIAIGLLHNRIFDWVNEGMKKMTGYTAEDLKGKSARVIYPDDAEFERVGREKYSRINEKGMGDIETRWKCRDGRIIDVYLRSEAIDPKDLSAGVVFTAEDTTEKKRSEEEIRKLAGIVRYSRELVNLSTPDGKMIFLNEAGAEMLGITPLEVHEHSIMDVIPDDLKEKVRSELLPELDRGDVWKGELRYKNLRTGKLTDVYATCFSIKDPETGKVLYYANTSVDTTERKKVEDMRFEALARFYGFAGASQYGMGMAELDGKIVFVNPTLAAMLGERSPNDCLGKYFPAEYYSEAMARKLQEEVMPALKRDGKWHGELELLAKDGRRVPTDENYFVILDKNGQPRYLADILTDITERKKAEENIRDIARFPQENPNPVMKVNCHGDILYANPASDKLLSAWGTSSSGKTPGVFLNAMMKICSTGSAEQKEIEVNDRTYLFVISPLPEEKAANIYGLDITERKRIEGELTLYRTHLEDLVKERTAELESFTYSVSHDLRAPLRAIDGFVRVLADEFGSKLDEEGRRITEIIVKNTKNMSQLIDDLLAFSRLGRKDIEMADIDMASAARSVGEGMMSGEGARAIDFRVGELPAAYGDGAMLELVLANLLSNAVKFTRKKEKAVIEVAGREDGKEKVYCIRDNGVGFDMKYVGKLFGVFQRLHSTDEFEGTGIGLAIVKRVINKHGGRVWAEGEVDKGAAFYFSLPIRR